MSEAINIEGDVLTNNEILMWVNDLEFLGCYNRSIRVRKSKKKIWWSENKMFDTKILIVMLLLVMTIFRMWIPGKEHLSVFETTSADERSLQTNKLRS